MTTSEGFEETVFEIGVGHYHMASSFEKTLDELGIDLLTRLGILAIMFAGNAKWVTTRSDAHAILDRVWDAIVIQDPEHPNYEGGDPDAQTIH